MGTKAIAVDLATATLCTAIACPACGGPCYAPADSDGERIDCAGCDARLVTVQRDGAVAAIGMT